MQAAKGIRNLALAILAVTAAHAGGPEVALRSGTIRPDPDAGGSRSEVAASDPQRWIVRFESPAGRAARLDLERLGAGIETPLPGWAYLVTASSETAGTLASAAGVDWVTRYLPPDKISPEIAAVLASEDGTEVIVLVHLFSDADPGAVAAELSAAGLRVQGAGRGARFGRIVILMTPSEVEAWRERLAERPEVFWLSRRYRRTLLNDTSIWVGQSGLDGDETTPVFDHGLYGAGQIAAILDTGIDADACYFRDGTLGLPPANVTGGTTVDLAQRKVVAVDFLWSTDDPADPGDWDSNGHGTHVAGTVAGDNLANLLAHDPGDGMAPGARLVIQDGGYRVDDCGDLPGIGCPVTDLVPIFQQAFDQGARFHSNSWGDNENAAVQNNYTDASEDVDEFMWSHPDFLVVFAAGNSGPEAGSVGSPSTAKNCISVGATNRGAGAESLTIFSSRGPTDDDRFKPDITFPGSSIVSARNDGNVTTSNCSTVSFSGTSMSCPGVAGLAVLARAYFADGFYPSGAAAASDGFEASAALVKATVINSAVSMTAAQVIPSNDQGWGRPVLDAALYFPGDSRQLRVDDRVPGFNDPGDPAVEYSVEVLDPMEPLKVTVVWTDFPSTPAASTHLVNDLDLVVEGPAGTFLGNVFSGGLSATGGDPDRRNNVEQVLLANPIPGSYTARVSPFAIPSGPQPFAVVITGGIEIATGPRPRYVSHLVDDAPPGGNGDGVLDPGETAAVPVTLRNTGGEDASSVISALVSGDPDRLKVYTPWAAWPDLVQGGEAVSLEPHFEVTLEPDVVCGTVIPVSLAVAGSGFSVASEFGFTIGRIDGDWPSSDTPLVIPKKSSTQVVSTLPVVEAFTVVEADVTVNIDHQDIRQIRVVLRSPTGTTVTLHDRSGNGVSGLHETYDTTRPPFAGTMQDFVGENAAGSWKLEVLDSQAGPVPAGTIQDWTLHLRAAEPFQCSPRSCGEPVPDALGSSLRVDRAGSDAVLSWEALVGASDYHVWQSGDPTFAAESFVGATGGTTSLTDTGAVAAPESRYYLVRAANACRWEGP